MVIWKINADECQVLNLFRQGGHLCQLACRRSDSVRCNLCQLMGDSVRCVECHSVRRLHTSNLELQEEFRPFQFGEESRRVRLGPNTGFQCEIIIQLILQSGEISRGGVCGGREGRQPSFPLLLSDWFLQLLQFTLCPSSLTCALLSRCSSGHFYWFPLLRQPLHFLCHHC